MDSLATGAVEFYITRPPQLPKIKQQTQIFNSVLTLIKNIDREREDLINKLTVLNNVKNLTSEIENLESQINETFSLKGLEDSAAISSLEDKIKKVKDLKVKKESLNKIKKDLMQKGELPVDATISEISKLLTKVYEERSRFNRISDEFNNEYLQLKGKTSTEDQLKEVQLKSKTLEEIVKIEKSFADIKKEIETELNLFKKEERSFFSRKKTPDQSVIEAEIRKQFLDEAKRQQADGD